MSHNILHDSCAFVWCLPFAAGALLVKFSDPMFLQPSCLYQPSLREYNFRCATQLLAHGEFYPFTRPKSLAKHYINLIKTISIRDIRNTLDKTCQMPKLMIRIVVHSYHHLLSFTDLSYSLRRKQGQTDRLFRP